MHRIHLKIMGVKYNYTILYLSTSARLFFINLWYSIGFCSHPKFLPPPWGNPEVPAVKLSRILHDQRLCMQHQSKWRHIAGYDWLHLSIYMHQNSYSHKFVKTMTLNTLQPIVTHLTRPHQRTIVLCYHPLLNPHSWGHGDKVLGCRLTSVYIYHVYKQ